MEYFCKLRYIQIFMRKGQYRKKGTACVKVEAGNCKHLHNSNGVFECLTIWISFHITLFYPPYIPVNCVIVISILQMEKLCMRKYMLMHTNVELELTHSGF